MRPHLAAGFVLLAAAFPAGAKAEPDLKRSVVKIFTTYRKPDYYQPWQGTPIESHTGSGAIISGKRILTNGHVVADATFIQVRKTGEAKKYTARVEQAAHDSELAILRVDDPEFFQDTVALEMGALPEQQDRVAAYGFPDGGDDLSITEGVVSRVEVIDYTHSESRLLAIQTDAAINPGNSGGPVIKDGRLVGVSFQSYSGQGVENIGYVVPAVLVKRFLSDIEDGKYEKVPDLGITWEKLENPAMRALYKLAPDDPGILINQTVYGGSADGVLLPDDVLMAIDGTPVDSDGTFVFDKNKRVLFEHKIAMHEVGDKVALRVKRAGKPLDLKAPLKPRVDLVPGPLYDVKPSYFVYAGLVFIPLTRNHINSWNKNDQPINLRVMEEFGMPSAEHKEIVVLSWVLPDEVNVGYHDFRQIAVDSINGIKITELKDVLRAFKQPKDGYHVIFTDPFTDFGGKIILDAKEAEAANKAILDRFSVPADRSDDLR